MRSRGWMLIWLVVAALLAAFICGILVTRFAHRARPIPELTRKQLEDIRNHGFHEPQPWHEAEVLQAPKHSKPRRRVQGSTPYGAGPLEMVPITGDVAGVSTPTITIGKPDSASSLLCQLRPEDLSGGCLEETVEIGGHEVTRLKWYGSLQLPKGTMCTDKDGTARAELVSGMRIIKDTKVESAERKSEVSPGPRPWELDLHLGGTTAPGWAVGGTYYPPGRRLGLTVLYERDFLSPAPGVAPLQRYTALASIRIGPR